ncbi:MAG: nicotinate-nucleotide--dimethylbenzimidazole phosphoribosyltransferase [Proteobacteria bacterium]|nr:nicotinate-nucleotide--dimethylbenzimidazole phosphoribosyltransferase [Pseudomonadota bacterium]
MRFLLTGLKTLTKTNDNEKEPETGYKRLKVDCCAICRTDAKIWHEGHRDLSLPRVPGHEIVVSDTSKNRFVIWPGKTCGICRYCKSSQENLCEDMEITGFHHDGGFADYVDAPKESLIPIPEDLPSQIACFSEPVGCALHALSKTGLKKHERLLVVGGGTVGLITAYAALQQGARPIVIEKDEEKIDKIKPFLEHTHIPCVKTTPESDFDVVINACDDPAAFNISMTKIAKGGRFSFFSGLKKNQPIESNLLNLMHYREHSLTGSYGCTKKDMENALFVIQKDPSAFKYLTEDIITPEVIPTIMAHVLSGISLKYIIHFSDDHKEKKRMTTLPSTVNNSTTDKNDLQAITAQSGIAKKVSDHLKPVSQEILPSARKKIDFKTKPLGALGRLEDMAVRMSLIQENLTPCIDRKAMFVFAADHGIAEEGVSAFPSEVTAQMVQNFLNGGAAINVLCRHNDIDIHVVDMGVKSDLADHPDLITKKIRKGTRNFALEPAMTEKEAIQGIENGMTVFLSEFEKTPIDIVGLGEMGIANTTSATAIICAITGIFPKDATGRGTGIDDKGVDHKACVIEKALQFQKPDARSGLDVLIRVGGYEIAGIVGAILAAASKKTAIVLDGVISTAAGLIASLICPDINGYLFSGHKSVEISQQAALDKLKLSPLIDLDMRLGEGTGAALAIDIIDAACRIMREMASFEEAGVSNKE